MVIHKEYQLPFPREDVFEAWVSEDAVVAPITRIESNPIEGGEYRLYSESPTGNSEMVGEFQEVIENEKLQYTWHWEESNETTLITVTFAEGEDGPDSTEVVIEHANFESEDSAELHDTGWDSYVEGLTLYLR